ncbi:MAG: hypothetical protein A2W99_11125 [Bacteroidetes bacterium GWF2_33_16]|nr:MAG: hypothetical protein A2X00_04615 [Bacteroidetes bacterium GWE2_32_14]OFY04088.1 MAG: hypothetical protein A2W99_11125 [Bacteroidetes bacterium GWF2_33_16]
MKSFIYLAILSLAIAYSCNDDSSEESELTGKLVYQSDCLGSKSAYTENNESCIEYSYDPLNKLLTFQHNNAGFNCCPGDINCTFDISNNTIIIAESEEMAGCNCNCLYNISIEVYDVPKKQYFIIFEEPYIGDQERLIFTIDLTASTTGEFCVERDSYPWGITE